MPFPFAPRRALRVVLASGAALALLAGCNGGGGSTAGDTVTVQGDVPIAYAKRSTAVRINPTNGAPSAPGGDLMVRATSSPSAQETNLTAGYTQGRGDVVRPEVSYDGKKIVFAMRCPADNTAAVDNGSGPVPACTGRWNIWEYDMSRGGLTGGTLRRLTASNDSDDVDPTYLPAGRGFVFASNRQAKSSRNQALGRAYSALDEYERERVVNLHTMDASGGDIRQITFNQSHDRRPVVRANGDIMFARWEHVANTNRFAIFRAKPDGTDLFVLYGEHSPGNSYLDPRETAPSGRFKGFVVSTLMPLSGTQQGGSLQFIDVTNYSEFNTPASADVPAQGGQVEGTSRPLNDGRGLSEWGRITTPYPLWDGTDRILLAYRPCEVTRDGAVIPCANLSAAEKTRLTATDRTRAEQAADTVQDNAPAAYAIYMFDPRDQTWLNVAAPPPGFMYVDPVAIQPRAEPHATQPTTVDAQLAAQDLALIEVRSVYDTDGLGRMGERMIAASDLGGGCSAGIAMTARSDPADTRPLVADIARIKDPADPAYRCTPLRFIRALRAVAPPSSSMGTRQTIGETDFEQVQLLGYAPIEPDGSFKLQVTADVPLALSVVDAQGRSFQTHTNWIQVRPGERRTCDGCHSPRRGASLNSGTVVNTMPAAIKPALAAQHLSGETMASLRTRLDPSALQLTPNPEYADIWADTTRPGIVAREAISLRYTGNALASDDLATPAPVAGVINYPEHIQPLWSRPRGSGGTQACTACHADAAKLDLRATASGSGRLVSYEKLVLGDPLIGANGQPVIQLRDGVPQIVRGAALVQTDSGAVDNVGQTRKSRLGEIMFGQTLFAGAAALTAHPGPTAGAPDHGRLLNKAEKRLLAEWMDLGGQYYNDPFNASGGVRQATGLDRRTFDTQVLPILRAQCVGCHEPGLAFERNRLILTGDSEGDYNVTLTLINDACNAVANPLLVKPSTLPHPSGARGQAAPPLPVGSTGYNTIASWIGSGCTSASAALRAGAARR